MKITLKNQFKKGTLLPVKVKEDRIILVSTVSGNELDITYLLDREEIRCIKRVGRAVAVVCNSEVIAISYYFNYHVHSQYSILDGMSNLKDIAKKSSGIAAITDHGNMFAMLKWQEACLSEGVKPVFGFEAYVEDVLTGEKNGSHGIILVKNKRGLKNAFELTSRAYDNFYRKPHVSLDMLRKYSEGIIFTSACVAGELAKVILEDYEGARRVALTYKEIFGEDFYIEIQHHHFPLEEKVNPLLIKLANELGVKVVAANDSHFIKPGEEKEHKVLLAVSYGKTVDEIEGFEGDGYWYKSDCEMVHSFWNYPEAIANTIEMAEKCDCLIETGVYHMPVFPFPAGFSDDNQYLLSLIDEGFSKRFGGTPKETNPIYIERLAYEKNVILSMGFSSYFLIVWDYVNWAKNKAIMVGPGRGSGAGSLCLYCLGITELDPIKYSLKFERFLNPDRISMPDIDMDFEDSRRHEVIEYVRKKYGDECVCNIITFGTMQAKNAIRDIARVTGEPVSFAADICKKINPKAKNLKASLEGEDASAELIEAVNANYSVKKVVKAALKLEGNPRQTGIHACGIVVADAPVRNYLPTAMVKDSKAKDKNAKCLVSQVTMAEVEEMGLLKMDFLGLKTMSVIGDCLKTVNRIRNLQGLQPVNYYMDVPLSDPYVYAEISEGNTYAIFQIESEGMRSFMKELFSDVKEKISVIESKYSFTGFGEFATGIGTDFSGYIQEMSTFGEELFERMIAGVSLYRPGPMDYIPDYIRGMNNPEGIVYDTPLLEPILKPTYGVIVYQEQVMDIVRSLAGFTAGQSDTIRKAMGKKKQSILDEYKPYFIEGSGSAVDGHSGSPLDIKGCVENGILRETAEAIWEKMADFAKYAFNKSHAAAYSVLTVVCAWLKHYYPAPYMCATLNTYMDNNEKLAGYISNTKDMGIGIIPPSVNKSGEAFKTNGKQILFGLKGLKGVSKTVSLIIKEREDNGEYTSITDFVARTYPLGVAKKSFEALNYSGCFDNFGKTRNAVASATEVLMDKGKNLKARIKKENENQLSFFDMLGVSENEINYEIPDKPEFPEREKLRYEHEVASIYISAHPLDSYSERLKELGVSELSDIKDNEGNVSEGSFTFAGEVGDIREIITRKGDKMATFVLSDRSSSIKVTVFPKDYETARLNLANNSLVVVKGNVRNDENYGVQLILSTVIDIDRIPDSAGVSRVMVNIPDFTNTAANDLKRIMRDYPGNTEIFVKSGEKTLKSADGISATSGLFMALHNRFGYENVYFE